MITNRDQNTKPTSAKPKPWQLLIVLFAVIATAALIAAPIAWYSYYDSPSRQSFEVVNQEMENIRRNTMTPAGAVERTEAAGLVRDHFLDPFDCIDQTCPQIYRGWFVPLEKGKEVEFALSILEREGYKPERDNYDDCRPIEDGCGPSGAKDSLKVNVFVRGTGGMTSPSRDVSPKQWVYVVVEVKK